MLKNAPTWGVTVLKDRDMEKDFAAGVKHPYPPIRYWTLMQMTAKKNTTVYSYYEHLVVAALEDSEPIVAVAAAECLGTMARREAHQKRAVDTLLEYSAYPGNELFLTVHALNGLERLKDLGLEIPESVKQLTQKHETIPKTFDYYRPQLIDRF